jgi:hypothetical protein
VAFAETTISQGGKLAISVKNHAHVVRMEGVEGKAAETIETAETETTETEIIEKEITETEEVGVVGGMLRRSFKQS